MKKKLSSDFSFIYRNLWVIFLVGSVILWLVGDEPMEGKVIISTFWILGAFLLWLLFSDLREVEIDGNFLHVKSGKTVATVPLSRIKSVEQNWTFFRYPIIIVKLKVRTRFGSEIRFIPHYLFMLLYRQHPVVNELRQLAKLPVGY